MAADVTRRFADSVVETGAHGGELLPGWRIERRWNLCGAEYSEWGREQGKAGKVKAQRLNLRLHLGFLNPELLHHESIFLNVIVTETMKDQPQPKKREDRQYFKEVRFRQIRALFEISRQGSLPIVGAPSGIAQKLRLSS